MINDPHLLFHRVAVVLFNFGGPSSLANVKQFLFNLFYDKRIISLSNPFRFFLAKFISQLRYKTSQEIYMHLGGASPILEMSRLQADALQLALSESDKITPDGKNLQFRVFLAMRYASPDIFEVMPQIAEYQPHRIILLPLYGQYSTTTTESFFDVWQKASYMLKFPCVVNKVTEYYENDFFIKSHLHYIMLAMEYVAKNHPNQPYKILFSAHGLPQKIIDKGDPYEKQLRKTVAAIMAQISTNVPYMLCYQSKVGPLPWLKPYTIEVLRELAKAKIGVLIIPISFTSEHSETLVELDIEYRELAEEWGIPFYVRVKAIGAHADYISCLRSIVIKDVSKFAKEDN